MKQSEVEDSKEKKKVLETKEEEISTDPKLLACVAKLYDCKTVVTSPRQQQKHLGNESSEDEAGRDEKEAMNAAAKKEPLVKELNVFQLRKQKDNEHFLRTRVKRMYGWIERCDEKEPVAAAESSSGNN